MEIGDYNLPESVIKEPETLIGKYAKIDLYIGDYLMASKLSDSPLVIYPYLVDFDGAKRAVSITVKSLAAGFSGKIEQGDVVSIIVADYGETNETISPAELQFVQVLAVTASTGLDTNNNPDTSSNKSQSIQYTEKELPATITLEVSPEQAKLLVDYENNGKIHIVFVYKGSDENCKRFLEEQDKIIEDVISRQQENQVTEFNQTSELMNPIKEEESHAKE